MSRHDEEHTAPGGIIHVRLAPAGRVVAAVRGVCGADELELADRLRGAGDVAAETAILACGVVSIGGEAAGRAAVDALLVGDRNRLLLAVLEASYGAPDSLLMTCAACGAVQELPFDPGMVLDTVPDVGPSEVVSVGTMRLRLPVGADLAALGPDASAAALLALCAEGSGPWAVAEAEVEAWISAQDRCAEIVMAAACAACGAPAEGRVDALNLVRGEMWRWGGILAEFDLLARRYHWSEAELLAMPARRRRRYVRMIQAEAADARMAS